MVMKTGTGWLKLNCKLYNNSVEITISDEGKGIENISLARQPMYTSRPDMERSGMGFTVMESFMDKIEVVSELGKGTKVTMFKTFKSIK